MSCGQTIYQRIQDIDECTRRLEDIEKYVCSLLDVDEKRSSVTADILQDYLEIPVKFMLVDDRDGSPTFEEPPPPYSDAVPNLRELPSSCIYPQDKKDHSDIYVASLPPKGKKRSKFREFFVFWKPSVVTEETADLDRGNQAGLTTPNSGDQGMPSTKELPDNSSTRRTSGLDSASAKDPVPDLKEPMLESESKEGTDAPGTRPLTAEEREEIMEFFCLSAFQPGRCSPEVKDRIGAVFRYLKIFGEYLDSVNRLCDAVDVTWHDTVGILCSRITAWNKQLNRGRPLARGCRRWGR